MKQVLLDFFPDPGVVFGLHCFNFINSVATDSLMNSKCLTIGIAADKHSAIGNCQRSIVSMPTAKPPRSLEKKNHHQPEVYFDILTTLNTS